MPRAPEFWQRRGLLAWALLPLAAMFACVSAVRCRGYRRGWLASHALGVPVVVVGNISVGGTGKTPLAARLVALLQAAGWRPGVVSRGYGGRPVSRPREVYADSDAREVGDEPLLIARRCKCPVSVCRDRVAAARALVAAGCNVIVSDDGLQHYRMRRDIEIAVIDGERRLGNRWPLPAGPLREPPARLRATDFRVCNGGVAASGEVAMSLRGGTLRAVRGDRPDRPLASLSGQRVHAVAGIGHPPRFFGALRAAGLEVVEHAFPDHHRYVVADLEFGDDLAVLMTEKDAVKCAPLAHENCWYLPVEASLPADFENEFLRRVAACRPGPAR